MKKDVDNKHVKAISCKAPHPIELKPDIADASRRWQAYWEGEMIDRPIVSAAVRRPGYQFKPGSSYRDRAFGDLNDVIERDLHNARGMDYLGESVPEFGLSSAPDEIAAFCGAEIEWNDDDLHHTNWSVPFVDDWKLHLPLGIRTESKYWLRTKEFYRLAAEKLNGIMLLQPLDLHTNMDILAAVRGPEKLCMDLLDCPDAIGHAMQDTARIFEELWDMFRTVGRMDEYGYAALGYSMEGVAVLACDFSALIGPDMFRRWVRPVLEREAALVRHAAYHWDGPRALVHFDELMDMPKIHTLSFMPDPGEKHLQYLDLFKRVQAKGKSVHLWGSVEELKLMHKELDPARTWYCPSVGSKEEMDSFLKWMVEHS